MKWPSLFILPPNQSKPNLNIFIMVFPSYAVNSKSMFRVKRLAILPLPKPERENKIHQSDHDKMPTEGPSRKK